MFAVSLVILRGVALNVQTICGNSLSHSFCSWSIRSAYRELISVRLLSLLTAEFPYHIPRARNTPETVQTETAVPGLIKSSLVSQSRHRPTHPRLLQQFQPSHLVTESHRTSVGKGQSQPTRHYSLIVFEVGGRTNR